MCVHVCVVEHLLDIITLRCLLTSIFLKKKLGLCIHLLEWKNFWYKKTKGRELLFWSGCSKIILSQEIPTSIF